MHDNYGVSGNTTTQMLSRIDKMLAATDAATFIVFGGINDTLNAIPYATSIANMSAILDKMAAAGRTVILVAEIGTGDTSFTATRFATLALTQQHMQYHQWLLNQKNRAGVIVVDAWGPFSNNTVTTNTLCDNRAGLTYDGRHPQIAGAFLLASLLATAVNQLFAPRSVLPAGAADLYDATANPLGALNANPYMAGTGGALGTNCSGSLAASWQASGGSGSTPSTAVYSKTSDAYGNPLQHIVVSGTPTGSASVCYYDLVRTTSFHASVAPGDVIEGAALVAVSAGTTGFISMSLRMEVTVDGVQSVLADGGNTRTAGQYLPTSAWSGVMLTPRFQIPAGASCTNAVLKLQGYMDPNVAAALTMDVSPMGIRKV
jgi:lysophospholipase L1-like esterase